MANISDNKVSEKSVAKDASAVWLTDIIRARDAEVVDKAVIGCVKPAGVAALVCIVSATICYEIIVSDDEGIRSFICVHPARGGVVGIVVRDIG